MSEEAGLQRAAGLLRHRQVAYVVSGQLVEGVQELASVGSWITLLAAQTETTNAATCHHEALFRDALSRAEAAEGQLGDLQKKNAALKKGKITASPQIFEEDEIPMKGSNKQLFTVIYYLGSIRIFRDCIFRNFISIHRNRGSRLTLRL
jgi:hypothetical protein